MAGRLGRKTNLLASPALIAQIRASIDVKAILRQLELHCFEAETMSATQIKAAEILLKKCLPDLSSVELTGKDGGALVITEIVRVVV